LPRRRSTQGEESERDKKISRKEWREEGEFESKAFKNRTEGIRLERANELRKFREGENKRNMGHGTKTIDRKKYRMPEENGS